MFRLPPIKQIRSILANYHSIAIVGLSPKPSRPSHQVAVYLEQAGYRIIPINPGHDKILGQKCFPNLLAAGKSIEIVVIFRKSEQIVPIARDAIEIGAKAVWLQEGIVNEEAALLAEQAGLIVVMDRCIKTDHLNFC